MFRRILTIFILSNLALVAFGQIKQQPNIRQVTEKSGCEVTELELDYVVARFKERSNSYSTLIIISRSAKDEPDKFDKQRVSQILGYFYERGIDKDTIVAARGAALDKFAYVEIYADGQKILEMRTLKKYRFCTSCCDVESTKKLDERNQKQVYSGHPLTSTNHK